MQNIAIILAGGVGSRLGTDNDIPKQYIRIAGKSILEHTIDIFNKNNKINEIAIVANPIYHKKINSMIKKNNYCKKIRVINSGETRNASSYSAIKTYSELLDECNLIFHDAVRPLLKNTVINNCLKALEKYNAVDVAINAVDTIITVNKAQTINSIPDRDLFMCGQTPQCFKLSLIKAAYEKSFKDPNFKATDDCGVVAKYMPQEKIFVVKGHYSNIKITYLEDIYYTNSLFQVDSKVKLDKIDLYDCSGKVIVIIGGNSGIGLEILNIAKNVGAIAYSASRKNGVDISDVNSVRLFLKNVYEKEGKISAVIVTAAILEVGELNSISYDSIISSVNVNYLGNIIVAKEAFFYLKQSKGSLIFFTSSSYTRGRKNYGIYSSSKAAVVNLTQALAEEWAIYDIKVNCINPERTATELRIKNFGIEPKNTLLSAYEVAERTLSVLSNNFLYSGMVLDIKLNL